MDGAALWGAKSAARGPGPRGGCLALVGRLACPDKRFAKWAKAVGLECGKLDAAEKDDMIAELDAVVAHLYGLTEPQLTHIFATFHEGWDYQPRLKAVLAHYRAWAAKA